MRKLLVISLLLLLFAAIPADAQRCGEYVTTLNVVDENENAVENASVTIVPQSNNELGERKFVRDEKEKHKFHLRINEGTVVKEKYKIFVSAQGFQTGEKELTFRYCHDKNLTLNLTLIK